MIAKIFFVVMMMVVVLGAGCATEFEPASVADFGPSDQEIMWTYVGAVIETAKNQEKGKEWEYFMRQKQWDYDTAFVNGYRYSQFRDMYGGEAPPINIYVRYENPVDFRVPWPGETEQEREESHFSALEKLAELQFPGWDFVFLPYEKGVRLRGLDIVAYLGHPGNTSWATWDKQIYLTSPRWFAHEFGHTVGLPHHYCTDNMGARYQCPEWFPPGETPCPMGLGPKSGPMFGPTDTFLLRLDEDKTPEDGNKRLLAIQQTLKEIADHYPP